MTHMTEVDYETYMANYRFKNIINHKSDNKPDDGPESRLQSKIMRYCREHGFPYFHDRSRKKNQPGWPDLIIIMPKSQVLFIELKAAGGKLRTEQEALKRQFHYLGHNIEVVRSYKQFLVFIEAVK